MRYIKLLVFLLSFYTLTLQGQVIQDTLPVSAGFIERLADTSAPDTTAAERNRELAELAYQRADYAEALRNYEHVFIAYPTARTYYNMALCYAAMERIEMAILYYERALLLEPTMREARHNLRLLYAQTKDALSSGRSFVFIDDLCYAYAFDTWQIIALSLFVLIGIAFLVFRFAPRLSYRRISFYVLLGLFFLWLLSLSVMAHQYYYQEKAYTRAIMLTRQDLIEDFEGRSNRIATLHKGTAVFPMGVSQMGWQEVLLADGRRGWIPLTSFMMVKPREIDLTNKE